MPYREAGEGAGPERERDVMRYGPFARSWRGLAIALLVLAILLPAVLWGGRGATLRCERARDRCELTTEYLFIPASTTRFAASALRGARYSSLKGNSRVTLRVSGRSGLELEHASAATRNAIAAFARDPRARPLDVSSWPSLMLLLLFMPLMLGTAGALVVVTLRQTRAIELRIVDEQTLRLRRSAILGSRERTISLQDVETVRVAHGEHKSSWLPGPARPAATISLLTDAGRQRPLSLAPLPGTRVHDALAAALGERLGCTVERTPAR